MPELSVIVPTFNERSNLEALAGAVDTALAGIDYEIIFVDDDSPDGTAEAARAMGRARVRVLQRIERKGLASAVIEGFMLSAAPYMAVIDGDMQHDERILPQMLARMKAGGLDLVIGTRNSDGGSMGQFSRERVALSQFGRKLSRLVCRADVSDPMSGFFMIDRRFLMEVVRRMSGTGFKVLTDILASSPRPVRFAEIGYTFRARHSGESKLDILVVLEYLKLLADKLVGRWVPVSFVVFSLVGFLGVLLHLALLSGLIQGLGLDFPRGQVIASCVVIAVNFLLNNTLTFRARRLRGGRLWNGLAAFYLACGFGLLANIWIADNLRVAGVAWGLAGAVGIVIGGVWNYWMSSAFVWRSK
jgi:dolichol-phosphate mannosyltransferase